MEILWFILYIVCACLISLLLFPKSFGIIVSMFTNLIHNSYLKLRSVVDKFDNKLSEFLQDKLFKKNLKNNVVQYFKDIRKHK